MSLSSRRLTKGAPNRSQLGYLLMESFQQMVQHYNLKNRRIDGKMCAFTIEVIANILCAMFGYWGAASSTFIATYPFFPHFY